MEIDSPTVHSQYSQLDLDELIRLAHQAQRPLIKKQLEKWVEEIRTSIQNKPPIVEQLPKQASSQPSTPDKPREYTTLSNFAWDQSDKFVKLYAELADVGTLPKEDITANFKADSFEIMMHNLHGKNYKFAVSKLRKEIDPKSCSFKVTANRLSVSLKKSTSDHWDSIHYKEDKFKKPKENEDPTKGMMDLMKQMYEDGDEETKRTISKTWYESRNKTAKDLDGK